MTAVAVTVDATEGLRLLGRLLAEVREPVRALEAVGFALASRVSLTFVDQRDPWGQPWAPLAPSTLQWRARRGGGGGERALIDTRVLSNSPTSRVAGGDVVEVGTPVQYASFHQFGTARGIPARPFLPLRDESTAELPPDWRAEVEAIVDGFIARAGA